MSTSNQHVMVVGTTEPQDFQLLTDGVAVVGTGLDVGIEWRETAPEGTITVAWLDQAAGTVRVTGTGDMAIGSYPMRFTLTDAGNLIGYVPNSDAAITWRVVRV